MRVEEKRIFISDLPETATQTEIENAFKNYGSVTSVEIKERKELGPKNSSLFFAYINIVIDDRNLQQCFNDFSNEKWLGHYVLLQIARESFLDRLKREREGASNTINNVGSVEKVSEVPQQVQRKSTSNGIRKEVKRKYKSSTECDSSDTDSSKSADKIEPIRPQNIVREEKKVGTSSESKGAIPKDTNETIDLIIKNNKGKVIDKNGLKIESVGNKPIIKIEKSKKAPVNSSEANLKRLQALNNMKKGYQSQKALIQASLSKIDSNSKNKIIFDEGIAANTSLEKGDKVCNPSKSINLFDDDPNDEEFEVDFTFKEQFEGKEGQKLLELQSKYKNDKRFVLDQRFLDKNETVTVKATNDEGNEEISLEEEKRKEYAILEQVLGKKIHLKHLHQKEPQNKTKSMLRFDPTQPDHSKFEINKEQGHQKKRKKKDAEAEILNDKSPDEKEMPAVSKEIFYKVKDNLKENLHVEQGFSLLSMFGRKDEEEEEQISNETPQQLGTNKGSSLPGKNPFKYDSSDDEDETQNIPNKDQHEAEKPEERAHTNVNRSTFWSEPFFFKNDDYKFQDGFDFIEKMKSEEKSEFTKLRKDLKDIVKTKVRNNQRKHKPFKKKLGGNKRKKMIKIKKALKR